MNAYDLFLEEYLKGATHQPATEATIAYLSVIATEISTSDQYPRSPFETEAAARLAKLVTELKEFALKTA